MYISFTFLCHAVQPTPFYAINMLHTQPVVSTLSHIGIEILLKNITSVEYLHLEIGSMIQK